MKIENMHEIGRLDFPMVMEKLMNIKKNIKGNGKMEKNTNGTGLFSANKLDSIRNIIKPLDDEFKKDNPNQL